MTTTEPLAGPPAQPSPTAPRGLSPQLRRTLASIFVSTATLLASLVALGLLWVVLLDVLGVNPKTAKTPVDVWNYLFNEEASGANRSYMLDNTLITLRNAALGFVTGMVAASVTAAAFVVSRTTQVVFMPVVMMMRTVPLVAMAPLIGVLFARGLGAAAVIGGVVVFFPVLINVMEGLRSVSPQALDLVRVNGGSTWMALRKVAIPNALPQLFLSLRISVPGSIVGAMIYEWLFAPEGLGRVATLAQVSYRYSELWTVVVIGTVVPIILYTLAQLVEGWALVRWGPNAGKL